MRWRAGAGGWEGGGWEGGGREGQVSSEVDKEEGALSLEQVVTVNDDEREPWADLMRGDGSALYPSPLQCPAPRLRGGPITVWWGGLREAIK